MSASPAPDQSGQSTPAANDTSKSQSQTPAPPPGGSTSTPSTSKPEPSPLDGLSPTELRKKLEDSRNFLRAQLEKKRKLDRDLVSLPTLSVRLPLGADKVFHNRRYWKRQFTRSKVPTSRIPSSLLQQLRTRLRRQRHNLVTLLEGTTRT